MEFYNVHLGAHYEALKIPVMLPIACAAYKPVFVTGGAVSKASYSYIIDTHG